MKIIKKIFNTCFVIMLMVMTVSQNVKADELQEIEVISTVFIKANVPEDFTENITFVLESEITQVRHAFELTKENEYEGILCVFENRTYLASVYFPSSSKYKTDIAENYDIAGEEVELAFNVTPIVYSIENDEGKIPNWNDDKMEVLDDEIDSETGLRTAESVLKSYEEKVSFIQDDPNFSTFLALYSGGMFKKYYLKADPMNTEEQWNNMREIERFNYYITYYMPYMKIINYEFSTANEMIEELISQKNILSEIENGDIVYNAIVEVWKWHYSYWQHTGTFYNFYNYYDGIKSDKTSDLETIRLTEKDKKELETKELETEELEDTEYIDNPVILWVKKNWLTAAILLIAGISFLTVLLHNRKENIFDENNN